MRFLLFATFLSMISSLSAQTTILEDNFDSYDFPGTVVGSNGTIWDTWSASGAGSTQDAILSNQVSNSPDLSIFVEGDEPGGANFNDLILKFPNGETYTSGVYEFNMKIFVEAGNGGYFNLGGNWPGYGQNHEIGARVFFNGDGTGQLDIADPVVFDYNFDVWNDIRLTVDLDAGTKSLFVNGNLISENDPWDDPSGFGLVNILGAAFASPGLGSLIKAQFFIDDVILTRITSVSVNENDDIDDVSLYPSPSKGQFTVELGEQLSSDCMITITDLSGQLIEQAAANGSSSVAFDLNVTSGMYFVIINGQKINKTLKILITN